MTTPLPPTTNDLDIKNKQRLLRQTRKLSQILGELPREDTVQPHLARCSTPAVEVASTDHPRQHQQHIRFSRHLLIDSPSRPFRFPLDPRSAEANTMTSQGPSSFQDALGRGSSTRPLPAHPSQLDSARFGLSRLRRATSTGSSKFDESARRTGHLSVVENKPTRSSSLRLINHQARLKDRSRRRTVHSPDTGALQAPSRKSTDISTPTHSQRRSVSLWTRRKFTKDDPSHQQRATADHDDAPVVDAHRPLTETERIQSIRRGRKLTKLFGAEPPISLYRVTSPFEDEPASPSVITGERIRTYLALSSSDLSSISDCSSVHFSHSNVSSISTSFPSPGTPVDPFQEPESDERPATPAVLSHTLDDDPDSVPPAHDPYERSDDGTTTTFRRRRLQAAKLSRFFGIAYNDLANPVAMATPTDRREVPSAVPSAEVGVMIHERGGGFWSRTEGGYGGAGAHEADMNDVIALLRQMPRA